jgi:succinate dehydrogenase/fumarate reductase cytochrome b subunit
VREQSLILHKATGKIIMAGHVSRAVLARSEAGIVGSNPTQGMDVWYVYVFILCLCCLVFR